MTNKKPLDLFHREKLVFTVREEPEETPVGPCEYAERFSQWAQGVIDPMLQEPSHIKIAQAKMMLLDKYFEWRSVVPKSHRNRIAPTGHTCLFHIFEERYGALKMAELTLTPPQLYLPEPPKKERPKKVPPPQDTYGEGVSVIGEVE